LGPLSVRQISTMLITNIAPLAPLAPKRTAAQIMIGRGRYKSSGRYPLARDGRSSNAMMQAAIRNAAMMAASTARPVGARVGRVVRSRQIMAMGPSVKLPRALEAYQRAQ